MTAPLPPSPQVLPTPPRVRRAAALSGACLAALMLAGFTTNVVALWRGDISVPPDAGDWAHFVDGRLMNETAAALGQAPLPAEAARLERGLSWLTIGDLGPRVRQGCPDWLFLNDERVPHPQAEAHLAERADAVIRIRDRLSQQGVGLMVVTVPDKSRVLADETCGLFRPAAFAARLHTFEQRLQAAQVTVVPTEGVLNAVTSDKIGTGAFLRSDTHWSERGARAAAQAVGDAVRQSGLSPTPHQTYDIKSLTPNWREGDLVRLAGIDWLPRAWQPGAERVVLHRVVPTSADSSNVPDTAPSDDDLFGDSQLPNIALIGTSFSRTSNFIPYLEASLQTKVGNFARDGGDFAGAAHAYFSSKSFSDTPPALVIWEIPERTLQMPWSPDALGFAQPK